MMSATDRTWSGKKKQFSEMHGHDAKAQADQFHMLEPSHEKMQKIVIRFSNAKDSRDIPGKEAAEAHLVGFFQEATLCAIHGKCKTLMVKDIGLVRCLEGMEDSSRHFQAF